MLVKQSYARSKYIHKKPCFSNNECCEKKKEKLRNKLTLNQITLNFWLVDFDFLNSLNRGLFGVFFSAFPTIFLLRYQPFFPGVYVFFQNMWMLLLDGLDKKKMTFIQSKNRSWVFGNHIKKEAPGLSHLLRPFFF